MNSEPEPGAPDWCPVLMYHRITAGPEVDPDTICTGVDRFRRQLRWMLDHGFAPVPLDLALQPRLASEGRRFMVTLDDGYAETLEVALPVLDELGVPATVFVPSGLVGGRSVWNRPPANRWRLMNRWELRCFHGAGHFVGSHGHLHSRLSGAEPRVLEREIRNSRSQLEDILGERVRFFAYPHHDFDAAAEAAVEAAGYDAAVGGRAGAHRRFNLHRVPAERLDERQLAMHALGIHRMLRRLPLPPSLRALARRAV